ncbi:M56 family metallopeptidase [Aureivirga marina]|uniref:M56 family metallopeptidase n=1 Tax=Aureivirga marina TaxID=1182451 RepID=UPI0018C9C9FE|nr:M56 family metallopeptidase [Aureivirga marina]
MIWEYLLKSTACLLTFFLFYKLFLEREKMHVFKRFYLIGILILSIIIPLITFTVYVNGTENINSNYIPENIILDQSFSYMDLFLKMFWIIYFLGVVFFSLRFGKNLISIILKIERNPKEKERDFIHVLLQENIIPHTFLNYIFLNKDDFKTNKIPKEVILHEQIHAKQKHSLDILFIELFQILFWFHPLLYFVKKSIRLNHEFLADEAVLSQGIKTSHYQEILLTFSTKLTTPNLANSINYSLIKKRFLIMKTTTSKRKKWFRNLLILPLLAILVLSFSTIEEVSKDENLEKIEFHEGASKKEIKEYNKLAKQYNKMEASKMKIKKKDVERLKYLYNLMTEKQRKRVEAFPKFPPMPPKLDEKSIKVIKDVNDEEPNLPPPPPKTSKSIKVIKGKNDKNPNTPAPPPKVAKESVKVLFGPLNKPTDNC